jgi:hypothetical protein
VRAPVGSIILLVVAAALYAAMLSCLIDAPNSDAFGRGLALAYGAILGTALWIVLAVLLVIAAVKGRMPLWAIIGLVVLVPLSCVVMWFAGDAYARGDASAIWVAALLPPLLALYALWARLPALHATFRPLPTGAVLKRLGPSGLRLGGTDLAELLQRAYASFACTSSSMTAIRPPIEMGGKTKSSCAPFRSAPLSVTASQFESEGSLTSRNSYGSIDQFAKTSRFLAHFHITLAWHAHCFSFPTIPTIPSLRDGYWRADPGCCLACRSMGGARVCGALPRLFCA